MIHYLIYLSSATQLYNDADLENILTVSRLNNERSGVTGLLLYHDGTILQLLEGNQEAVERTYRSILSDLRHTGIQQMAKADCESRAFADWSMGFRRLSDKDWSSFQQTVHLNPVADLRSRMPANNSAMHTLMTSFITLNFQRQI